MTTYDAATLFIALLAESDDTEIDASLVRNGNKASSGKSISFYSTERGEGKIAVGGYDNNVYDILPISIVITWTEDQKVSDEISNKVFSILKNAGQELTVEEEKVSFISLLDSHPIQSGRDENGLCESVIRANIFYYL